MVIICGGIVEKDGKYLLVQESKAKCYGKWCLPAGHLEIGETLFEGAIREIKEETNCDVELIGICEIANQRRQDDVFIAFTFATKLLTDVVRPQKGEILATKWFTYAEAIALGDQLRAPEWIISALTNYHEGKIIPLDFINTAMKKEAQ